METFITDAEQQEATLRDQQRKENYFAGAWPKGSRVFVDLGAAGGLDGFVRTITFDDKNIFYGIAVEVKYKDDNIKRETIQRIKHKYLFAPTEENHKRIFGRITGLQEAARSGTYSADEMLRFANDIRYNYGDSARPYIDQSDLNKWMLGSSQEESKARHAQMVSVEEYKAPPIEDDRFDRSDLVSFGKYLLSEERTNRIAFPNQGIEYSPERQKERLKEVCHADVENWRALPASPRSLREEVTEIIMNGASYPNEKMVDQIMALIN